MKTRAKSEDGKAGVKDKKHIRLTKIKQWYMPADVVSYKRLRKAGVPLLKFHENMLPTISMIAKRKGVTAELVSFKDTILNPFLDRVSDDWRGLHEDTSCKSDSKTIRLTTTHRDAAEHVEPVLEDLRKFVGQFFERWGYKFTFEVSKKREKLLVHIEYWFSNDANPVIPIKDDPIGQQSFELTLGFLKLSFTTDDTYLNVVVHASRGGFWAPIHTSRCLYSQISNIQPTVEGLLKLTERDPEMAERVVQTIT